MRKISQSIKAVFIVLKLSVEIFAGDIENVDEHLYVFEDVFSLRLEILLHKEILATTVPQR